MGKRVTSIVILLFALLIALLISIYISLQEPQVLLGGGCGGDGDFNLDGEVNYLDLEMLVPAYFTNDSFFDLDCSGTVDYPDIELMQSNFQRIYDLNQDSLINAEDVTYIENLFNTRLWEQNGYEPIADLFPDGTINSIDYSFLIYMIDNSELGSKTIHKNQLFNEFLQKQQVRDMTDPIRHINAFTFYWGTNNLNKATNPYYGGWPSVQEAYDTFSSLSSHSFILRYISSTTSWENAEIPYTNWYDYGYMNQFGDDWYLIRTHDSQYLEDAGVNVCPFWGYEIGDRVASFCNSYPGGTRYRLKIDDEAFQQWAGGEIANKYLTPEDPYFGVGIVPENFWDGASMDNFFHNSFRVDTNYGPDGLLQIPPNVAEGYRATWRGIMQSYASNVKPQVNAKGYKIIPNTNPHPLLPPFDYLTGDLLPYIDGFNDEGFVTRSQAVWGGPTHKGIIQNLLNTYETMIDNNKIVLIEGRSDQDKLRGFNPLDDFPGVIQEFYYSYAAFHMVKEPGLIYFDYGYDGDSSGDFPFWIKDWEIVDLGKPLDKRYGLGMTEDRGPEVGTIQYIFGRDFENGKVFVRDRDFGDGPIFTIDLPSETTWYDRLGNIITEVNLKPYDGAFAYTFNPIVTILDLDLDGDADENDKTILTDIINLDSDSSVEYCYKQAGCNNLYELIYDINTDGILDQTDVDILDSYLSSTTCGNGIPETGEQCDDGDTNDNNDCTNSCNNAVCQDGTIWNQGNGNEECDDGNNNNQDICTNSCLNNICGDGFINFGVEQCDDGNNNNNDGCDSICGSERSQYLGFQTVSSTANPQDIIDAFQTAGENAEYIFLPAHINWPLYTEGWENVEDSDFDSYMETVNLANQNNLKIYAAIDPLDVPRTLIEQSIPEEWGDKSFENPLVRAAFKNYALRLTNEITPPYLTLGMEINSYYRGNPADFPNLLSLIEETYDLVKQNHPEIRIGPTFQYEELTGEFDGTPQYEILDLLSEPKTDFIGISTYPRTVFEKPSDIPSDYYTSIRTYTVKPLIISESGWPTASIDFPSSEFYQVLYLKKLLKDTNEIEAELLINWLMHDWTGTGLPEFFQTVGLLRSDSTPKPAWTLWTGYLEFPISIICGNNIIETGEQCDDGNKINGDGCTEFCTIETPDNDGNNNNGNNNNNRNNNPPPGSNECTPSWSCSLWADCLSGEQARTCTDLNNCNVNENKPIEERNCEGDATINADSDSDSLSDQILTSKGILGKVLSGVALVLGALILLIISMSFFLKRNKQKVKQKTIQNSALNHWINRRRKLR